jgi:hypothetical protein
MNRNRLPIVVVMLLSLFAAGLTRHWGDVQRRAGQTPGAGAHSGARGGLSRMNSYALALLLGGLRGPLVMILWPSAEQQKQDKNLEDFDTKIEWIRMLQAEFDTVHIFQMWNKAYNISVQMANLPNKYRTIIDAIDYGHSVDAERPNNINILVAIGDIYFGKLGSAAERFYYRPRVREETKARTEQVRISMPAARRDEFREIALAAGVPLDKMRFGAADSSTGGTVSIVLPKSFADEIESKFIGPGVSYAIRMRQTLNRDDPGFRRMELDPVLDATGKILPQYLRTTMSRPENLAADADWYDGSELQFLKQYEPFPYGVSPLALAYNYQKRAQVLQSQFGQSHAQYTESVIDGRPATMLRNWSEEEWHRGRRAEIEAFARPIPSDENRRDFEQPTAGLPLDTTIPRSRRLDEALYSYQMSARTARDSVAEYNRHLEQYQFNITTYLSTIADMEAQLKLVLGDYDYLKAMLESAERSRHAAAAAEHYRAAAQKYQMIVLRHYVTDSLVTDVYPPGVTNTNIATKNLPPEQIDKLYNEVISRIPTDPLEYQHGEEIADYGAYIRRAQTRLKHLPGG